MTNEQLFEEFFLLMMVVWPVILMTVGTIEKLERFRKGEE